MAENLNYDTDTGCWVYGEDLENASVYGRLYEWETACDVCPEGWHLPADKEWKILETYVGMELAEADRKGFRGKDEAHKLKASSNWSEIGTGIDLFNLSIIPGGYHSRFGGYYSLGKEAFFWTSSSNDGHLGWYRMITSDYKNIYRYDDRKNYAYSVRCVKDQYTINDKMKPLNGTDIRLDGFLNDYIQLSIENWNKADLPYAEFVGFFRSGRPFFAAGEMWGKAVRSGAMLYRYTRDKELKNILTATVRDLLTTIKPNGSISCTPIDEQPDGPGGDLWERKYILLGLDTYYSYVQQDSIVLNAMIHHADAIINQIGYPPKTRIIHSGWSSNRIESFSLLEPIMRLYKKTNYQRYLNFAAYIIEEGGAKGYNLLKQAHGNVLPFDMGGDYPKAYEMLSFFEGLVEYYRATGDEYIWQACVNFYRNVKEHEITIIGSGGGDQPYHTKIGGEAWNNTAIEQTHPKMERMMETCVGVTWLKFCSQIYRTNADPLVVDEMEKYIYNGLLGAMKPDGDGFSYVNKLNGIKTNPKGWGGIIDNTYVTCCNLNGPIGLAYIPYVTAMQDSAGPVINLYHQGQIKTISPGGQPIEINVITEYPKSGIVKFKLDIKSEEEFSIKFRIPQWSQNSTITVNNTSKTVDSGTYTSIQQKWKKGDVVELNLDVRSRLIRSAKGDYQALVRGPIVLTRDENIDTLYHQPVKFISKNEFVDTEIVTPNILSYYLQLKVPTDNGPIYMVDYASANSWRGKHICTWLEKK
jgi:uncharacterized protein (TIGR02145 family)